MGESELVEAVPSPEWQRLIRDYLDHLTVERGLSANTVAAYRRDLSRYARFQTAGGTMAPAQVHPSDLLRYQQTLTAGDPPHRPLAPASVARAMVAVRNLHTFAQAEGITSDNPGVDVHPPRPGKRLPRALDVMQVQRLIDGIERDTPVGLRDAVLLELLYGTGARISEVVDLDVDDLTRVLREPDAALRLVGKGDKERLVPLGSFAREAVEAWLVRGRPAWAGRTVHATPALLLNSRGGRLSRQSAWAIVQDRARRAGITTSISPHSLRHSFATHLLDGGADIRVVQELLGHSSVTTTQIYTEVTAQKLREVFLSAHPRSR